MTQRRVRIVTILSANARLTRTSLHLPSSFHLTWALTTVTPMLEFSTSHVSDTGAAIQSSGGYIQLRLSELGRYFYAEVEENRGDHVASYSAHLNCAIPCSQRIPATRCGASEQACMRLGDTAFVSFPAQAHGDTNGQRTARTAGANIWRAAPSSL